MLRLVIPFSRSMTAISPCTHHPSSQTDTACSGQADINPRETGAEMSRVLRPVRKRKQLSPVDIARRPGPSPPARVTHAVLTTSRSRELCGLLEG